MTGSTANSPSNPRELPAIQRDLDASLGQLEWTLTAYVVALAAPAVETQNFTPFGASV